jgi:hypothetical protein
MERWIDTLSEDWPSQPPSERSDSIKRSTSALSSSSPNSIASQSRIPRYKHRSTSSFGPNDPAVSRRRTSGPRDKDFKNVLSEKTSSNLNASHQRPTNGPSKLGSTNPGTKPQGKRHSSTGSMPADTVQHRFSPAKNQNLQGTPEWKRRVLKGNIGPGEQADLFGPIGLENIFRPPTVNSKVLPKQRKGVKIEVASVEDYPSSPPPYPSAVITAPVARPGGENRRQSTSLAQMEVLEEEGEHSPKPTVEGTDKGMTAQASGSTRSGSILLHSRVQSGQSEDRDEQLSEICTRHNTVDGHFDYAAVDGSMRRLHSQMDKLRLEQQNLPGSRSSDDGISYAKTGAREDSLLSRSQISDLTSQSLPDDLSMGTEVFASNGGFINIRRGGYSNEGSFQRRPLSPSSLPDFDDSRLKSPSTPDRSKGRGSEKSTTSRQRSRQAPRTPKKHDSGNASSPEQPRSSGSPLKLFDKYDTFTNDRLVRRMSRFEETLQQSPTKESDAEPDNGAFTPRRGSRKTKLSRDHRRQDAGNPSSNTKRRISSFGRGELDGHHFPTPPKSKQNPQCGPDANKENRPQLSAPLIGRFRFDRSENRASSHEDVAVEDLSSSNERNTMRHQTLPQRPSPEKDAHNLDHRQIDDKRQAQGLDEADHNARGKRLPYSPAKDPQPKRRRTLGVQEDREKGAHFVDQATVPKEPLMKSTLGRKRKDALYDSGSQAADPKILAMRQILRPRTPTPSQTGSQGKTHVANSENKYESRIEVQSNTHQNLLGQDLQASMDPPTKALVDELASFSLGLVQDTTTGARKASVTTADFFNEAQQIMQLLRAQGRPQSQMSALELEPDHNTIQEEVSLQESTKDEFSRPPSREGGSLRRLREPPQLDARVISHLRKFEEKDVVGVALSSSLKTLQIEQSKSNSKVPNRDDHKQDSGSDLERDPPNIRILDHTIQAQKHKHSSSTILDLPALGVEVDVRSYGSQSTSGPSTGRSVPTGSSRGSGKRAVIAPETVSHLLSDHVAGMTFDHAKQVWVKRKTSKEDASQTHNRAPSEFTEDDPFGDVPDLSVDELEELARTQQAVSAAKLVRSGSDRVSQRDYAIQAVSLEEVAESLQNPPDSRAHTADGQVLGPREPSSAPSDFTRFTSSVAVAETRATSWGDEALQYKHEATNPTTGNAVLAGLKDEHAEEVEHEISILEGRVSRSPKRPSGKQRQARVITVAFSSPLIDQMQPHNDGSELWEGESELNLDDSPIRFGSQLDVSASKKRTSSGYGRRSVSRSASRRVSIGSQSYIARPMSRLDEEDELSFLRGSDDARNMSMVVSTPLQRSTALQPPGTGQQSSIGFRLSPLPDFTVHQIDRSFNLDLDHVAKRRSLLAQHEVEGTFSLATQELVKKLTDVEPYEPYWDFIRNINLQKRGLLTLHGLYEYCGRIEELDVSDNELGQLNGAPPSLRNLRIRRNCLSNLTAWGHLHNLQYLDVSGNQIQSLKGFFSLVHLRELKADDNEVESLDGIFELDGLISLSLRRNRIGTIDFDGSNL